MGVRLNSSEGILKQALEDLNRSWAKTEGLWKDKAREDFEREYLDELRSAVKDGWQAMKAVDSLLRQVIREVQ